MIFVYNFLYGSDFLYLFFLALYKAELENVYLCKQFYSPYSHLLYGLLEKCQHKKQYYYDSIYDKSKNYKRHKRCVIGREILESGYKYNCGISRQHKLIHYEFAQQRCHCVRHRNAELREVIHLHRLTAR